MAPLASWFEAHGGFSFIGILHQRETSSPHAGLWNQGTVAH